MIPNTKRRTNSYINARQQHPAWQLLASRRGPIMLSCLQALFNENREGVEFEAALLELAEFLREHSDSEDAVLASHEFASEAKKELRNWIKRGLIVERKGKILSTDALDTALRFVDSLDNRIMTSTASRLSIVQREIENLETNLNPDPKARISFIKRKISALEIELDKAQQGNVEVLSGSDATEAISGIYKLAIELQTDFRRVEDSFRVADQQLRQSIINEQNNRGEVVDKLLDSHDSLLETEEGKVFHTFQQQLSRSVELDEMKHRLRSIVEHPKAKSALNNEQRLELRWLAMRLVEESESVIRARARSERDVKSFIKTGLAAEHHRVGELLNAIFNKALDIDWSSSATRKLSASLPPIALANPNIPAIERLRFKSLDSDEEHQLNLSEQATDLNQIDEEFWEAFDDLDREALIDDTKALLQQVNKPMSIGEIANQLPPTHDLEAIVLWLTMALESAIDTPTETEEIILNTSEESTTSFTIPRMMLTAAAIEKMELEF